MTVTSVIWAGPPACCPQTRLSHGRAALSGAGDRTWQRRVWGCSGHDDSDRVGQPRRGLSGFVCNRACCHWSAGCGDPVAGVDDECVEDGLAAICELGRRQKKLSPTSRPIGFVSGRADLSDTRDRALHLLLGAGTSGLRSGGPRQGTKRTHRPGLRGELRGLWDQKGAASSEPGRDPGGPLQRGTPDAPDGTVRTGSGSSPANHHP